MHALARLPAAALAVLLLLLAACAPLPAGEATATLLTAGEGVQHNGRPAVSGERLAPGDWVRTGYAGSALVRFSDGTTVQIAEADNPVHLDWTGARLDIRTQGTLVETITGTIIKAVSMITDLAGVFNSSHFIAELEGGEFRHYLFTGQARMIFPEPGLQILPGQYALVGPAGEVVVRPIPPAAERDLRRRLDRWRFTHDRPAPRLDRFGLEGFPGMIIIGPAGGGRTVEPVEPDKPVVDPRRPTRPVVTAPLSRGTVVLPRSSQDSIE